MDANGARTHLVLGLDDWREALVSPIDENACYSLDRDTIGLRPEPFVFPDRVGASRLTPAARRGTAADRYGNWYWIGPDRTEIHFQIANDATAYRYWPADDIDTCAPDDDDASPFAPSEFLLPDELELSGLAITTNQYLVVGVLNFPGELPDAETSGIAIFDLHGGGPPVFVPWPAALEFRPFDMACLPAGGIAILDVADPDTAGVARLWQLDRFLRVIDLGIVAADAPANPLFVPKEAAATPLPATGVTAASAASDLSQSIELTTNWAIAIDALPDSSVVVLDRETLDGRFDVQRWRCGVQHPFELRRNDVEAELPDLVCNDQASNAHRVLADLVGHDVAIQPGPDGSVADSTIFIVDDQGDQAFAFSVAGDGAELIAEYHPLRLFSGKALVSNAVAVHYDLEDRWFPVPTRPNPRYASAATLMLAPELAGGPSRGFDGRLPGTVWHRFVMDGSIPAGTSVLVESRAGDDAIVLETQPWLREPSPYRRGLDSEVPFHSYEVDVGRPGGSQDHLGSFELLFQHAVGRYLQVRITLQGDGRHTPRIWAVRNHYPRFSYLDQYLPDLYQQDETSASFLDRYLSNAEGWFTTFEGRITNIQRLFDADTTDPEFLPWLATWVGGVVETDWSEERQRLFVKYASRMFARRGTKRGLTEAIRLATDECLDESIFFSTDPTDTTRFGVRIVEHFRTRETPGVVFGDPTELTGPGLSTPSDQWNLAAGRSDLERRWRIFRADATITLPWAFPTLTPTDSATAKLWHQFVDTNIEPTYSSVGSTEDVQWWRRFLNERYRRISDYNTTWNLLGVLQSPSFATVRLPTTLPADGAPLQDWITFVSATLPIRRNAHRFTVLVPIPISGTDAEREAPLGPVRRVVEANQPAHTAVEVKPYWGEFRVGAARVGFETIVGEGSRYVDMVLGTERLAYGALPGGQTWRLDDRLVVGRNRIERAVVRLGTGGST